MADTRSVFQVCLNTVSGAYSRCWIDDMVCLAGSIDCSESCCCGARVARREQIGSPACVTNPFLEFLASVEFLPSWAPIAVFECGIEPGQVVVDLI